MSVEHVEVLVEEPSMEAVLTLLLPKMLGAVEFTLHPHQGKSHLLKALPGKLQGYSKWLPESHRIVIVVDRDDDDCVDLKQQLENAAQDAGLQTKTNTDDNHYVVLNRLAIEELESWFFGDWEAVAAAYPRINTNIAAQSKYRHPDQIAGGTWEAFERILKRAGYFRTGLGKIAAARAVAQHMDPDRNRSPSFQALRSALVDMLPA